MALMDLMDSSRCHGSPPSFPPPMPCLTCYMATNARDNPQNWRLAAARMPFSLPTANQNPLRQQASCNYISRPWRGGSLVNGYTIPFTIKIPHSRSNRSPYQASDESSPVIREHWLDLTWPLKRALSFAVWLVLAGIVLHLPRRISYCSPSPHTAHLVCARRLTDANPAFLIVQRLRVANSCRKCVSPRTHPTRPKERRGMGEKVSNEK